MRPGTEAGSLQQVAGGRNVPSRRRGAGTAEIGPNSSLRRRAHSIRMDPRSAPKSPLTVHASCGETTKHVSQISDGKEDIAHRTWKRWGQTGRHEVERLAHGAPVLGAIESVAANSPRPKWQP